MMDLFATMLNHKLPMYICPTFSGLDSDSARSHPRESKCSSIFHVLERRGVSIESVFNNLLIQVFNQVCWHQPLMDFFPTS